MNDIAIIGAGGFGREVKWLIDSINQFKSTWNFLGYFDDDLKKRENISPNLLLGKISDINTINKPLAVIIAIGNPILKEKIFDKINNSNISYPTLIHPNVIIGNEIEIERGCIICASCILTSNIKIHQFVTLNLACTVGHDSLIGPFCSIMPSVNISGEVIIEKNVYIGTGARIINQISIEKNSIIGAGAVVTKKITSNSTAVGVPAKIIKTKNEAN